MVLPSITRAGENGFTAVCSQATHGYTRTRLPDNSFKPETYVFGEGGRWDGSLHDKTIDDLPFLKIAGIMAPSLEHQRYLPGKDPAKTDLLIVVYWGTTSGTEDSRLGNGTQRATEAMAAFKNFDPGQVGGGATGAAMSSALEGEMESAFMLNNAENQARDQINFSNAMILGFKTDLERAQLLNHTNYAKDLVEELEANRYFVILKAYDFQLAWKEKKKKLLRVTRFSIRERGHNFGEQLAAMTQNASRFFGQDSNGLVRKTLREGRVELGELKVVGYEPAK